MPQRKVSRSNTKNKKKISKKNNKKLSKKKSVRTSKKKISALREKKFTGRRLLPRRAIIFPEPIMDGGGVDREMLGL